MRTIRLALTWFFIILGIICTIGGIVGAESNDTFLLVGLASVAAGVFLSLALAKRCPACQQRIGDDVAVCKCGRVMDSYLVKKPKGAESLPLK